MTAIHRYGLAAWLVALAAGAQAQPVGYAFEGPNGPSVLRTDALGRPVVPPARPDFAVPAIPVAKVMNGSGFGLTGFNYFDEALLEGRLNGRAGTRTYVLVPPQVERYGVR